MNAQLVLENVSVRLPNRVLFEDVNWSVYEGMRVALAGRNGSGKSTLLRILAGRSESSTGQCIVVGGKKLRLGFLDQSLLDSAVVDIKKNDELSMTPVSYIVSRMELGADPEEFDPYETEWETRKILGGLGFSKEWMDGPLGNLSGGWLLRVFIANALVAKPQILLLDEPTNHLDLSSIQWLEEFLQKEYKGSLLLVTHDVSLQKRTTDSLAVLHGGRFFFRPNQRDYLTFRESLGQEKYLIQKAIESTEKKIDEAMDFFMRFRAKANTANRAQSKFKAAETMRGELAELKDRLARVEGFAYNLKFRFRSAGPSGKFPAALEKVDFRYSDDGPWILKNVSVDISRGQRIAIIGDNGAGKTTLLNTIAQRLQPNTGSVSYGHNTILGYFGQHQLDELSLEDSVVDNLRVVATGVSYEELRGWLGAFGFIGDDAISKKAKVLSGGERARLAMLRILCTRINFCLLDEPTNHLDIETKELLKDAIRSFDGTSVFVSHDREFVGDIADRILYLTNDHKLVDHLGTLETFFEKYPQYVRHLEGGRTVPSQAPVEKKAVEAAAPKISYEERKKYKNLAKSLEKKIQTAEADLERLGNRKTEITALLADGSLPADKAQALSAEFNAAEAQLVRTLADWEKWSSELERIREIVPDLV
ncbi:ATP-binding cassette domain-containing protein [bacterium]|nr:ATP-binding cassette domain-containing protein [bacterium]